MYKPHLSTEIMPLYEHFTQGPLISSFILVAVACGAAATATLTPTPDIEATVQARIEQTLANPIEPVKHLV